MYNHTLRDLKYSSCLFPIYESKRKTTSNTQPVKKGGWEQGVKLPGWRVYPTLSLAETMRMQQGGKLSTRPESILSYKRYLNIYDTQ